MLYIQISSKCELPLILQVHKQTYHESKETKRDETKKTIYKNRKANHLNTHRSSEKDTSMSSTLVLEPKLLQDRILDQELHSGFLGIKMLVEERSLKDDKTRGIPTDTGVRLNTQATELTYKTSKDVVY